MKRRILVVDDDETILLALKVLLQSTNLEVNTCDNLDDAVSMLNCKPYDGIIADLRLTGTFDQEGLELLRIVKIIPTHPVFALMTACGAAGIRDKAMKLGADFYFEKPISMKELRVFLNSLGSRG